MNRRQFISAAGAAIASPYVTKFVSEAKAQTFRVRRNLQNLPANDPFFKKYEDAITIMHRLPESNPRSWRAQAIIHPSYCPHGLSDFVLWHRHYITFFERICGELIGDPSFALCYFDWTANRGRLPTPFFTNSPLNVLTLRDRSDYSSPRWGQISTTSTRGITATQGLGDSPSSREFTAASINSILSLSRFDLFQGRLETSPHNNGHVISGGINGHMVGGLSSLDPMFWLHHCNVDRLAAQWQRAGNRIPRPSNVYAGQFVDAQGSSVTVRGEDALDIASLGYTYDEFQITVVASRRLGIPSESEQTVLANRKVSDEVISLGKAQNLQPSTPNTATSIPVATANLVDNAFKTRTFRPTANVTVPRLAVEQSRILAKLTVGTTQGAAVNLLVNVFVNCPYLTAQTSSDDRHYAGTFSFFGVNSGHNHGGAEPTYLVDVTEPLRDQLKDGRIVTDNVNVQVFPVPAQAEAKVEAQFTVSSVELIAV